MRCKSGARRCGPAARSSGLRLRLYQSRFLASAIKQPQLLLGTLCCQILSSNPTLTYPTSATKLFHSKHRDRDDEYLSTASERALVGFAFRSFNVMAPVLCAFT